MGILYIVVAVLIFGFLIAIHELGHFTAAKKLGVKVNEFAIGMGPKILSRKRGETVYAWRLLPIGGACVMEGEDEDVPDPRAFTAQPRWKRVVILAAGPFMNLLAGIAIVAVFVFAFYQSEVYALPNLAALAEDFPNAGENGLLPGDRIVSINGNHIYYANDFLMFMAMPDAEDGAVRLVISRGGERITYPEFPLVRREYTQADGSRAMYFGLSFETAPVTFWGQCKYTLYTTWNYVRLVKVGLVQLISGQVGVRQLSGPVGIVTVIHDAGTAPEYESTSERLGTIFMITGLIAVNLAVMNLLPIPALDGGRIFALLVTFVIEKITRRRVNPKYESFVHAAGLLLLLGLMAVVMVSDVLKVFGK
ncbi:MAG: site-2 protease family protein [Oscillospiraceae bacterium]|jgi:regulator of sigma E protease|nr:site-2 protease family protein [Oscillospiraceae bacterium]